MNNTQGNLIEVVTELNTNMAIAKNCLLFILALIVSILVIYLLYKVIDKFISF